MRAYADEYKRGSTTLLPLAIAAIEAASWPGNVRELQNCVKRAVIMAEGGVLSAADLLGVSRPTLYDLLNRFGLKELQR